jgi:hypothetical protein
VPSCRQAAIDAAQQEDFEAFHDLAWRAAQKGRPNDPELMLLLARAQSLSGRPGDALVMLRRIAELGIAVEAVSGEDFRRVRALPGWPDVESAMAAATRSLPAEPIAATRPPSDAAPANAAPPGIDKAPSAKPGRARTPAAVDSAAAATTDAGDALRLPASPLEAVGLAYDSVSRRFVLADRRQNKLIVADEIFKRVNDLIGADAGGFGSLTAVEIDRRRGDLWVTSTTANGRSSVHKLQLVSGRILARLDVPEDWLPAALNDMTISEAGALLLVDGAGSRLLTVSTSGQGFTRLLSLGVPSPASIASGGGATYVAHAAGLSLVDLQSRQVVEVRPSQGVTLTGLRRIRWYRGTLVAIQDDPGGEGQRLVRIRIGRAGRVASAVEALDDSTPEEGSALTISGNSAYFIGRSGDGPTIRRVPLR